MVNVKFDKYQIFAITLTSYSLKCKKNTLAVGWQLNITTVNQEAFYP